MLAARQEDCLRHIALHRATRASPHERVALTRGSGTQGERESGTLGCGIMGEILDLKAPAGGDPRWIRL